MNNQKRPDEVFVTGVVNGNEFQEGAAGGDTKANRSGEAAGGVAAVLPLTVNEDVRPYATLT